MDHPKEIQELNEILKPRWVSGLWNLDHAERPSEPKTRVKPHVWKWNDIYDSLVQAKERISVARGTVERRVIRLVNPGMADSEMTSHTILLSFQLIQPGEVAPGHRHTMSAFRFILQGNGAYTNVDGQKMVMESGDLILTPHGCWHEHAHEGDQNMVWIDGLDVPFIQALQQISFDPYNDGRLPVKETVDPATFYGETRPIGETAPESPKVLHYRWRDTYVKLQALARVTSNSFDGATLEYVNPQTGRATFPTMSCRIQMLRAGEKTQSHRHTSTSIFHAYRGSGTTVINGQPFKWQQGDTFIVPLWHWHEHANASSSDEAILFSMHDEPILRAFGLYREVTHPH